jgi:hypothetical protein
MITTLKCMKKPHISELQNAVFIYILESQIGIAINEEPEDIIRDDTKCQFECSKCEFSSTKYNDLKCHTQTTHQSPKIRVNKVRNKRLACEVCDYVCRYNIQMKKHQEREHKEERDTYGCDRCDFRDDFLGNVWKHKLAKHSEIFNANSSSENLPKDILLNLLAEQNANLMEEVVTLKKSVKEVIMQVTYDFEEIIENMKKVVEKQHLETRQVFQIYQKD